MNEVRIVFKNYKTLKDGEFNISNGSVFFIQGQNGAGKTSFVNLLQSIMEVKDETVNPVTFGEQEGFAVGTITGADGRSYQFRYDYNVDNKRKFTFITPEGKSVKSIGEMRSIFNYTHFTVDEFFSWSLDAKGRQKQKDIIMKLLSDKEREKINDIDKLINNTTGEKFVQRQTLNREIELLKGIISKGNGFTEEEKRILSLKDQIAPSLELLLKEKKEAEDFINSVSSHAIVLESAQKDLDNFDNNFKKDKERLESNIQSLEQQIKDLQERLKLENAELGNLNNNSVVERKALADKLEEASKGVDKEKLESYKLKLYGQKADDEKGLKEVIGLEDRIANGNRMANEVIRLETLNIQYENNKKQYDEKEKKAKQLTEEIETLRKSKQDIITNSDSIPHGFEIGDDYISIDGIPFMETDLCKSAATKAIAKLMMKVNKAPIMLMGDAEHLGYEVLDELAKEAEANNKIMIFAEHVRDADELKLICYDELEHRPANEKPKTLF